MWPVTIRYLEETHPRTAERARLWEEDYQRWRIACTQSIVSCAPEPEPDPVLHEMIQEVVRRREQGEHHELCPCAYCIERRCKQDRLYLQQVFVEIPSGDIEELRGSTAPMDMCANEDALEEVCAGGNA